MGCSKLQHTNDAKKPQHTNGGLKTSKKFVNTCLIPGKRSNYKSC